MRPPFRDVFAVEPLSKWKMAVVLVSAVLLSAAVAVVLADGGMFAYVVSVFSTHTDSIFMDSLFWTAVQKIWISVGLMAFANVFVAYWVLHCVNSAEIRVILRWALHVSIWAEFFYLSSIAWTYVTIF